MNREDHLIDGMSRFQHVGRVSALSLAEKVLGGNFSMHPKGHYVLWKNGRWTPASLDDVMQAANTKLVQQSKPQIQGSSKWVVPCQ